MTTRQSEENGCPSPLHCSMCSCCGNCISWAQPDSLGAFFFLSSPLLWAFLSANTALSLAGDICENQDGQSVRLLVLSKIL
jgi:hypothetical protein